MFERVVTCGKNQSQSNGGIFGGTSNTDTLKADSFQGLQGTM
jgi:hypothetical protein